MGDRLGSGSKGIGEVALGLIGHVYALALYYFLHGVIMEYRLKPSTSQYAIRRRNGLIMVLEGWEKVLK